MSDFVDLKELEDNTWEIQVKTHDIFLVKVIPLGRLSKEQAIREAMRRGYKNIRCWNKEVLAAMKSGALIVDQHLLQ